MSNWVDFKELRSKLRFTDVLHHYRVELKIRGDRATGFCPLPGHKSKGDGKRRSPSFSCNLAKGIFNCFSCGGRGNVLDFACLMDGGDPDDAVALREAALALQETFGLASARSGRVAKQNSSPAPSPKKPVAEEESVPAGEAIINAPLDFELKHLDPKHPYLRSRGVSLGTIAHFGLGYCSKGIMAERIAIPLHDPAGTLVGYAGRLVDDAKITDENPKYRFPGTRDCHGKRHEFRKSLLLYNAHRLIAPLTDLIVVEGFASVWHLHEQGYPNAVALMGSSCSFEQAVLICDLLPPDARVWAFTDGDDAGERCAHSILTLIAPCRLVGWIKPYDGRQPTDCSVEELEILLKSLDSAGAAKSGTPDKPRVANVDRTSNVKPATPMAAGQ